MFRSASFFFALRLHQCSRYKNITAFGLVTNRTFLPSSVLTSRTISSSGWNWFSLVSKITNVSQKNSKFPPILAPFFVNTAGYLLRVGPEHHLLNWLITALIFTLIHQLSWKSKYFQQTFIFQFFKFLGRSQLRVTSSSFCFGDGCLWRGFPVC